MNLFKRKSNKSVELESPLISNPSTQLTDTSGSSAVIASVLTSRFKSFVYSHSERLEDAMIEAIRNGVEIPEEIVESSELFKLDLYIVFSNAVSALKKLDSSWAKKLLPILQVILPYLPESERAWDMLDWELRDNYLELIAETPGNLSEADISSLLTLYLLKTSDSGDFARLLPEWALLLREIGSLVVSSNQLAIARWEVSLLYKQLTSLSEDELQVLSCSRSST